MRLNVSSESSAGQRIHMKNQALFKIKVKKKCRLLQFLFGALWAKYVKVWLAGLWSNSTVAVACVV